MITVQNTTKKFGSYKALDSITLNIDRGCIYGLVGTNGSGKSTLLRLISGVYRPDGGEVMLYDQRIFENPLIKQKIFFVSDDLYFHPQATLDSMAAFYKAAGYTMVGTHLHGVDAFDDDLHWASKTLLVTGSEARGMSDTLSDMCDVLLRLPMPGKSESLNAAVATGVFLYTHLRLRKD